MGEEFGQLGVDKGHIVLPARFLVFRFRASGAKSRATLGCVIGTPPIQMGVVEVEPDALLGASISQFTYHVASERCGIDHIVIGNL